MSQPPSYMQKQNAGYDQGDFHSEYNPGTQGAPGTAHLNQVVISQPSQSFIVEASPVRWGWCNMVTAAFGFFCCQPFGLISLICALVAYSDHKAKDFGRSKNKRNLACGFGVAAIVIGSLLFLICVIIIPVSLGAAAASVAGVAFDSSGFSSFTEKTPHNFGDF